MNKKNESVFTFMLVLLAAFFIDVVQGCESTITRHDYVRNVDIVCCSVTCPKDTRVKKCKVNGSADTCEPCPQGTYMDDSTNSQYPLPCASYNCPPESIPAQKISDSGCGKKCVCDVERGYVGTDPCICMRSRVTCPEGTALTIYNNCTEMYDKASTRSYDIVTTKAMDTTAVTKAMDTSTDQEKRPEVTESNVTVKLVVMSTPSPGNDPPESGDHVIIGVVAAVVVVLVLVAVIGLIRWWKWHKNAEGVNGGVGSNPGEMIPLTEINVQRDRDEPHDIVNGGGESTPPNESVNNGHVTRETEGDGEKESIPSCEHNGNVPRDLVSTDVPHTIISGGGESIPPNVPGNINKHVTRETKSIGLPSAPNLNMMSLNQDECSLDMDPAPELRRESFEVNI